MKKKRLLASIALVSVLCLMLMLVACGEKATEPEPAQKEAQPPSGALPDSSQPQISAQAQQKPEQGKIPQPQAPVETFLSKLPPQTVVARVNGTEVKAWLLNEVDKIHRSQIKKQLGAIPPEIEENLSRIALDQVIGSELLYQHALANGVSVDEKTVDDGVKSVKMSFPSEASFKEFLDSVGYTEKELVDETRKMLVINQYYKDRIMPLIRVSDQDAKNYYDNNKEEFRAKELVRASYILFPFTEDTAAERKALIKEQAEKVLAESKGGSDFAELAKKYSKAPNADKGGDLGYFPRGKMVSNFEKIAFTLPIGEISDVFETQFGYNIMKVTDRRPEGYMPFEEIKPMILDKLMEKGVEEAINKKVEELQSNAKIEILLDELKIS